VELNACGSPARVGVRSAECGMRSGEVQEMVTIEAVRETWRIDDEWWRDPITRTYYEVLLEGGARVVIFVDHLTLEWFLQKP
jgi:hypothetical protein